MKWMTLSAALLIVGASFGSAEAGLFGCCKKNNCCQPTCCEAAPVCCEPAPVCCEPAPCCEQSCGCKKGCFLSKLFKGCHKKNNCCQSSCCEAAPVCCEPAPAPVCCAAPAPVCCEPAPTCCEPAPCCEQSCGCKKPCFLSKLFKGCHKKNNCCQTSCCEAAPACGCGH